MAGGIEQLKLVVVIRMRREAEHHTLAALAVETVMIGVMTAGVGAVLWQWFHHSWILKISRDGRERIIAN